MFQPLGVHLLIEDYFEIFRQTVQFRTVCFRSYQSEPVPCRRFRQSLHQIPDVSSESEIIPMANVNGNVQRQGYTLVVASFQA